MAQSYRLRLYADALGLNSISVTTTTGGNLGTAYPAGASTPCFDMDYITVPVRLTASLQSGYRVQQWIINADGTVTYATGTQITYSNTSNATNVQIRLVVEQEPQPETRYATLAYNANGGTGAPTQQIASGDTEYLQFVISSVVPQRSGYVFLGWALDASATYPSYYPSGYISIWTSTTYPGPTTTLYAVWAKDTSGGGVWIGNGNSYQFYLPYIYTGSWQKYDAYIYTGSWTKAVQ